jgi:hypothetical protein
MRHLFCPVCASDIRWRPNEYECIAGASFSSKLGNSIKNAVYGVDAPTAMPRKPSIAPYLWCPNCTAELDKCNDRQRRLKCSQCSLELPVLTHFELMEIKKFHEEPDPDNFLDSDDERA